MNPKPDLVEQRKQERNAANAQPREKTAAHRRAKRADAEQAQPQQGKRRPRRAKSIAGQQQGGNRQHAQHFAPAQRVLAEHLQYIRQQSDAGTEQQQSGDIQRMRMLLAIVRQVEIDHEQARSGRSECSRRRSRASESIRRSIRRRPVRASGQPGWESRRSSWREPTPISQMFGPE